MTTSGVGKSKLDWNGDGVVNHDDVTFHIHDPKRKPTARELLEFQKAGGEVTAEDFVECAKAGGIVHAADLKAFQAKGGHVTADILVQLKDAGVKFHPSQITELMGQGVVITGKDLVKLAEGKNGVKFKATDIATYQKEPWHMNITEEDLVGLKKAGVDVVTHDDVTKLIEGTKKGDSATGLLNLMKKGTNVTAADLKAFKDAGGVLTATDLAAIQTQMAKKGATLTADDVTSLLGKDITSTDVVKLSKAGVKFSSADLDKLQNPPFSVVFSGADKAYFKTAGAEIPYKNPIPEGSTWDDIKGMQAAGVKLNAKDIIEYLKAHPDQLEAAKGDSGLRDPNLGQLYCYMVDQLGATFSTDDVMTLQKENHCFSGRELSWLCENGLKLTKDDFMKLQKEYQCNMTVDETKKICAANGFTLTPQEYKDLKT